MSFTPSTKKKPKNSNNHADIMEAFGFKGDVTSASHSMMDMGNDRIVADFTNNDRDASIVSLEGTVEFPSTGGEISAVYLQDPSNKFNQPEGTNVNIINATQFTIDGFTALAPSKTYELIVVFGSVPATDYGSLDLNLAVAFD